MELQGYQSREKGDDGSAGREKSHGNDLENVQETVLIDETMLGE